MAQLGAALPPHPQIALAVDRSAAFYLEAKMLLLCQFDRFRCA